MNNETQTTVKFAAVAIAALLLALVVTPSSEIEVNESDQGGLFYPDLDDAKIRGLEIFTWDEDLAAMRTFKVQKKQGRWVIPPLNYPADAVEQMAKVSAGLNGLEKKRFISAQPKDHPEFGVLDPTDDKESSRLTGIGTRVNLLDGEGNPLASYIFGKDMERHQGFKYVRLPGKNRVYGSIVNKVELSTRFRDWVETDLLKIERDDLKRITIENYVIDEQAGEIRSNETLSLIKDQEKWLLVGLAAGEEMTEAMGGLETALDEIVLEGVKPKPAELNKVIIRESKQAFTPEEIQVLRRNMQGLVDKGFSFVNMSGGFVSDVGQVEVGTKSGLLYTLWFGEVAPDTEGFDVFAEGGDKDKRQVNRYLIITVRVEPSLLGGRPVEPKTEGLKKEEKDAALDQYKTDLAEFESRLADAKEKAAPIAKRFEDWYYIIADEKFRKIRLTRKDLVKKKAADEKKPGEDPFKKKPEGPGEQGPPENDPFKKKPEKDGE